MRTQLLVHLILAVAGKATEAFVLPTVGASEARNLVFRHGPSNDGNTDDERVHLVFPGGGIFFYWQAGFVTYLKEQRYDLGATSSCGASAGALAATLSTNDVDFYEATELALRLAEEANVWDRKGGLAGIWGPMIETWLGDLLPEDAAEQSKARNLSLLVTPVPFLGKSRIDSFHGKQDLISCNMASVHLPLFLNGKIASEFRGSPHIDGSFLSATEDYVSTTADHTIVLDYKGDPKYKNKSLVDAVEALSKDGIYQLLEDGKTYARILEEQGGLQCLPKQ